MRYDVFFDNRHVGTAEVTVHGLYYDIRCRCSLFTKEICKLAVVSEKGCVEIGICVPKESHLVLDRKVPMKTIGNEIHQFTIHRKRNENNTILVSLNPDEPFAYIPMLETAKLIQGSSSVELLIPVNDQLLSK